MVTASPPATPIKKPRDHVADPAQQKRGEKARRDGNAAQNEWARLIGGRNIGRLNGADVEGPDGMYWEVKTVAKPNLSLIQAAMAQAATNGAHDHRPYGVAWRIKGRPPETRWLVIVPS